MLRTRKSFICIFILNLNQILKFSWSLFSPLIQRAHIVQFTCCTEFLYYGLQHHNNVSASLFICLISRFIFVAFHAVLYIS